MKSEPLPNHEIHSIEERHSDTSYMIHQLELNLLHLDFSEQGRYLADRVSAAVLLGIS